MNPFEVILQKLGLKADDQVLENLKRERLLRLERLLKQCGKFSGRERPIEKSLQIILDQIQPSDKCWIWTGHKEKGGYGALYITGKNWRAHRFIFMLLNGPIPYGKHVLHQCDNPSCVRPDHLFLGTQLDNNLDALMKHRTRCILNEDKVLEMRKLYTQRGTTVAWLAKKFGVSWGNASMVVKRKTWKHI